MSHIIPPPPLQAAQTSRADAGTGGAQFHPVADMFPLMEGEEFDALGADIKANGLVEDIVLYEGMILDGRHRYRAGLAAGAEPRFTDYRGDDPTAYVISKNLHRRHLTAERKREIIALLIKATPEKSDRAIADEMKVDKNVVSRMRKKAEATGAVAPVAKRVGKDGKARKQPARNGYGQPTNVDGGSSASLKPQENSDRDEDHVADPATVKTNARRLCSPTTPSASPSS